jgi:Protein of unknown function (DUF1569)
MTPRELKFADFAAVRAELDRLQRGYDKAGTWDLAQVCNHLDFFITGSLDGHRFKVPWLFKALFGRLVLRRILSGRKMKTGVFTPQKPLPEPGGDATAAVANLKVTLARFEQHQGKFHDSPFFGHLTPDQWRDLHLIHCAHHLGFLLPRDVG